MKIYTIVIETRKSRDDEEVAIDIIPFWKKKHAINHLVKLFDKVLKDRNLDLNDEKNDGICFIEKDYFSFYNWVGGDWIYKATIYERTIYNSKVD